MMTIAKCALTKAETIIVVAIENSIPALAEAREIIAPFHAMIRRKTESKLTPWLGRARPSLVASFVHGVTRDEAAIRAAITSK